MSQALGRKAKNVRRAGRLGLILFACFNLLYSHQCPGFEMLHPELPGVEVVEKHSGNLTLVALKNPQQSELTVSLDFALDNLTPNVRLPIELIVPPQCTTAPLVILRPTNPAKTWHYSWSSHFNWGSPRVEHAAEQRYFLPYTPGQAFRVIQGQDSRFSHTGEDRYAIDFGMPIGTPVLAARDGLVVLARDGFDAGRPDPAFKNKANEIFIRHSDGTLAEYVHLQKDSIAVRTGDTIRAGQMLGLSGNSGYSQGPHLHFMVFRAKDSKTRESFPLRFNAKEGSGISLREGRKYTAIEPATEKNMDLQSSQGLQK